MRLGRMRFFLKLKQVKKAIEEKILWMKIENFNWLFFQQRGWGADKKVHLAVLTNLMILLNCTVLHGLELQWYYLSDHEWLIYIFRKKIGRMILNQWFILVAVKSSCRIQQIWWCDEVLNPMHYNGDDIYILPKERWESLQWKSLAWRTRNFMRWVDDTG